MLPLILYALALFGGLIVLKEVFGASLLFGVVFVGIAVAIVHRHTGTSRSRAYAVTLALSATAAGLGAGWIREFPLPLWALLQLGLVLPGLVAGWGLLKTTGLSQAGIGANIFLARGVASAVQAVGIGVVLALPWSLLNVALGAMEQDAWVQDWWQPFVAAQPAISEEAWGRVLLVPLAYVALRTVGGPRAALFSAVVVVGYWFAYLHTDTGVVSGLISAALIGTLFALPVSFLWLYRGFETAVGFHFAIDFFRFLAAYLVNQGILSS
jgi:hypothetical protein